FEVMEDRQRAMMLARLLSDMALAAEAETSPAFDIIAARLNEGAVEGLVDTILANRDRLDREMLEERLAVWFGEGARQDREVLAESLLDQLDWPAMALHADLLIRCGGKADAALAHALISADPGQRQGVEEGANALIKSLLTGDGTRRKRRGFPVGEVLKTDPAADARTETLLDWAEAASAALKAQGMAARSRDLHHFAGELLSRYTVAKAARGLLDYDDLITRSRDLLTRADIGAWVLYRMDQGIDHILVDEAQDTAPAQWEVIEALSADFFSGEGARPGGRSVFVVGDEKQSIYSFQGAEPQAFGATRRRYRAQLDGIGARLEEPELVTSFRSAPGLLAFVDRVFSEREADLTLENAPVAHLAHRSKDAARIDLWPLIEPVEKPEPSPWWDPVDLPAPDHPKSRLARALAAAIADMIGHQTLPPRDGQPPRAVAPGDILVLVQKRDRLAQELIRTLKSQGVPVAGADRLSLAAELAVKDLIALIKVVLLPADDLSLAAALRSPLFDISEEALFDLAHGRPGTLWQAVVAAGGTAAEMLADLSAKAGFQGPFALLETILSAHDGRRHLLARLGPEAEDPVDELLAQALIYEARETPTLPGFISWIEAADITLKREMESGSDQVRVMTVHGAKGLEAPVVILPDTVSGSSGQGNRQKILTAEDGTRPPLALWPASKALDDPITQAARAASEASEAAEAQRKLYVALTRAEDWLILAGAGREQDAKTSWYGQVQAAFESFESQELPGPPCLDAPIRRIGAPVDSIAAPALQSQNRADTAPGWLTPAPREARPARPTPSTLAVHEEATGSEVFGGEGLGRSAALARGTAVHLLLERLPELPAEARPAAASLLLARQGPDLTPDLVAAAIEEALRVLSTPDLAPLFAPGTLGEASIALPLTGTEPGMRPMLGRIDRLVPGDLVRVIDYKTDPQVPATAAEIPAAYIVQLALYARGAAALYPGREILAEILWTRAARLMPLAPRQMDQALDHALARQGIDLHLTGS
ncbi:MAG: double-strand break repair helicase AddA, partial [Pseudomonadota bacterium]